MIFVLRMFATTTISYSKHKTPVIQLISDFQLHPLTGDDSLDVFFNAKGFPVIDPPQWVNVTVDIIDRGRYDCDFKFVVLNIQPLPKGR